MEESSPKVKKTKKTKKNYSSNGLATVGVFLIMVAVVLMVWFFLHGETVITDNGQGVEASRTLTCEAEGVSYPYFSYDESTKKEMKINTLFKEGRLDSMSLIYKLYYNNSKEITDSENLNRVAMNEELLSVGLGVDSLGLKFSKGTDLLQFSLYAGADEINSVTVQYFMLKELSDGGEYPATTVKRVLENKGFSCALSE